MDHSSRQLTLQVAYQISEEVGDRSVRELFWAMDRFYHDLHEIDEHAADQRSEATQRCAVELDRRGVPVRDPRLPPLFPGSR